MKSIKKFIFLNDWCYAKARYYWVTGKTIYCGKNWFSVLHQWIYFLLDVEEKLKMELMKILLTEPIGILSLITVGFAALIIVYFLFFFIKKSGGDNGDDKS